MAVPKKLKDLCPPALLYFIISIVFYVISPHHPNPPTPLLPSPPREGRTEAPVGTPQFPPPFGGPDRGVEGPALSLS